MNFHRRQRIIPVALAVLAAWLAVIVASPAPAAAAPDDKTDKVDKLFAAWDKTTTPGAALAIIKDGRIIYERGYGMARLEDGIPNTPDKVFDIGSVSKQFTATCTAMLIRDGKIGLDDDIRKYLPELPVYEKPVTVRHLLHHTSGIRDYNALLSLAGFRPESDAPTVGEAYEVICRQKKLNYLPGEEYSYTNSGYFLLSQIVERVSGKSLNAFAQERIFRPLGMTKTLFQDDHNQIIKDRATGYDPAGNGFSVSMSNWDMTGDGNVYTTVRDLARWDQAFYTNALGKDLMDMLHTQGVLNSGKRIDYAFGLVVREHKGVKVVEHGGAWVGFRAAIVRFPEQKLSVAVLANLGSIDPSGLAFSIADIYLADLIKEPAKPEPAKAAGAAGAAPAAPAPTTSSYVAPKAELEALMGNWQDKSFGRWVEVSLKDDKLVAALGRRSFQLTPVASGRLVVAGGPAGSAFEVTASEKGKPARAKMTIGTNTELHLEKAAPPKQLSAAEREEYTGTYVSEELIGVRYKLTVDKDAIRVEMRTMAPAPLKPMAPDKFTIAGMSVEFTRGKDGKVDGFTLSAGRAAGIAFAKR